MPAVSAAESAGAVICEYNPFHFGHAYQLQEMRKRFGTVICVLGGNVTQRGEAAVADRYLRAQAALANGADLVVELPLPWCCASAREFAAGGVAVARGIGADMLVCSAESEPEVLHRAAAGRAAAEADIRALSHAENLPYPVAAERVLGRALANRPNDILAVEYLCAAGRMPVWLLQREAKYAASTWIRRQENPLNFLPPQVAAVFAGEPSFPRNTAVVGTFLLGALRSLPLRPGYGVTAELAARLRQAAGQAEDWEMFLRLGVSKMFTVARVRRAAWSAVFGFPADLPVRPVPYTLLLAANARGRAFLNRTGKSRTMPVLPRPLAAEKLADEGRTIYRLNRQVNELLRLYYGGMPEERLRPYIRAEEREQP